jgi:hypothetical protein
MEQISLHKIRLSGTGQYLELIEIITYKPYFKIIWHLDATETREIKSDFFDRNQAIQYFNGFLEGWTNAWGVF